MAGVLGGVVAVVIGAILIGAGVIDTGSKKTVIQQAPLSATRPVAQQSQGGGLTVNQIYNKVGPGVAFIQSSIVQQTANPFGFPQQQKGTASGSGFVLNKQGNIVTNAHVVDGASNVQVSFNNGNPVPATIVGKDLSTDVAVLKVDPSKVKLTPVALGDSSKLQVGDPVVAIGNPFDFNDTVTTGVVSALQREIQAPNNFSIDHAIQTDAAINPGNSGGPLLNANGDVVGINSQIATSGSSKGNVGIGFAIPINLAKQVIPQLIKSGKVQHAFIWITTAPIDPTVVKAAHLPVNNGALVQAVQSGSPAAKAGLQAGHNQTSQGIKLGGDLIVGVAGHTINKPDDIAAAIADKKPGDTIQITFFRGQTKKTVSLTLANRPATAPSSSSGGGGGAQPSPLP